MNRIHHGLWEKVTGGEFLSFCGLLEGSLAIGCCAPTQRRQLKGLMEVSDSTFPPRSATCCRYVTQKASSAISHQPSAKEVVAMAELA
jgi:hypothetical protein